MNERRFTDSEICNIESQRWAAYSRLQETSKRVIKEYNVRGLKSLKPKEYLERVSQIILENYPVLDKSYYREQGLVINQLLSDQSKGNTSCRFSAVLFGQIVYDLGGCDGVGFYLVHTPPNHVIPVIDMDGLYYTSQFVIGGKPKVEIISANIIERKTIYDLSPDGLLSIDGPKLYQES